MQHVISALRGYAIEARDGRIGTIEDFLFDDRTWKLRWIVADVGTWWTGSKVLLHPSSIRGVDHAQKILSVGLSIAEVKESPDVLRDQPVSQQMERNLNRYYGWDPLWAGNSYFGGGAMASPLLAPSYATTAAENEPPLVEGDPHLRSVTSTIGSHLEASDGGIGHLEDFLVDETSWVLRYLIIDTKNWWPGRHVLVSPFAITDIDYFEHKIHLRESRSKVQSSPSWSPEDLLDQAYEERLHKHYSWPGYGW